MYYNLLKYTEETLLASTRGVRVLQARLVVHLALTMCAIFSFFCHEVGFSVGSSNYYWYSPF